MWSLKCFIVSGCGINCLKKSGSVREAQNKKISNWILRKRIFTVKCFSSDCLALTKRSHKLRALFRRKLSDRRNHSERTHNHETFESFLRKNEHACYGMNLWIAEKRTVVKFRIKYVYMTTTFILSSCLSMLAMEKLVNDAKAWFTYSAQKLLVLCI